MLFHPQGCEEGESQQRKRQKPGALYMGILCHSTEGQRSDAAEVAVEISDFRPDHCKPGELPFVAA